MLATIATALTLAGVLDLVSRRPMKIKLAATVRRAARKNFDATKFIANIFSWIFGNHYFSKRSFLVSFLISISSVIFMALFVLVVNQDTFYSTLDSIIVLSQDTQGIIFIFIIVVFNLLFDFFSYSQTRALINIATTKNADGIRFLFFPVDAVASLLLFVIGYSLSKFFIISLFIASVDQPTFSDPMRFSPNLVRAALPEFDEQYNEMYIPADPETAFEMSALSDYDVYFRSSLSYSDQNEVIESIRQGLIDNRRDSSGSLLVDLEVNITHDCIPDSEVRNPSSLNSLDTIANSTFVASSAYRYVDFIQDHTNLLSENMYRLLETRMLEYISSLPQSECLIPRLNVDRVYFADSVLENAGPFNVFYTNVIDTGSSLLTQMSVLFVGYIEDDITENLNNFAYRAFYTAHMFDADPSIGRIVAGLDNARYDWGRSTPAPFSTLAASAFTPTIAYFLALIIIQIARFSDLIGTNASAMLRKVQLRTLPFTIITLTIALIYISLQLAGWFASAIWSMFF
ncbi:hypothetical protein [Hyphobacterium marinum]|uniref:Uncharacterized protein n=1 Tax=Hyphobacterium marinum TaxID=3116574 RepID=A0ABU7LX86_9PROT|nr:hypothetical protein [Hyphobacterium sp. Y6023]MEE2566181.1 hypothetical protein [Hyphobacterium sp. Y6023]